MRPFQGNGMDAISKIGNDRKSSLFGRCNCNQREKTSIHFKLKWFYSSQKIMFVTNCNAAMRAAILGDKNIIPSIWH